jgi:oligopeptide transport system permease protein
MRMALKRLLAMGPLLLLISALAFALVRLAPGGPFDRERQPASPETERALQAKYHLDEPLWLQYARYLADSARGDLGPSLKYRNHTVNDLIAQGLPVSLSLGLMAFALAIGVGVPLGVYGAARRHHWDEQLVGLAGLLAICVPALVVGPLLILGFAIRWPWFPVALWATPRHFVLPTLTLGIYFGGRVARLVREGMAGTLHQEFIIAARAKGLSELAILRRHAFRIGVLPLVSYSGPLLADLLTGSFVVENLFQIPGIGVFMVNSALNRDYPTVVGLVLVYAVLLLVLNLVVDLAYGLLDPRARRVG